MGVNSESASETVTERLSALVTRVRAPNPSPMTLEGTNSLIVRAPGTERVIVVDPGPHETEHLERLCEFGTVEIILLTHGHPDHSDGAQWLHEKTGAPVRASHPHFVMDAPVLRDGELVRAAGCVMTVVATPGHSSDSVCFFVPDDEPCDRSQRFGSVLTGDTILGRGSTVIDPTGTLNDYINSLGRIANLGNVLVIPGHGDPIIDARLAAGALLEHRIDRLVRIERYLRGVNRRPKVEPDLVTGIVEELYPGLDQAIAFAARLSVIAQLEFLSRFPIPPRPAGHP